MHHKIIVDKCVSLFARCTVTVFLVLIYLKMCFLCLHPEKTFCCSGVKISLADNVFVTYFYISNEISDIWL